MTNEQFHRAYKYFSKGAKDPYTVQLYETPRTRRKRVYVPSFAEMKKGLHFLKLVAYIPYVLPHSSCSEEKIVCFSDTAENPSFIQTS